MTYSLKFVICFVNSKKPLAVPTQALTGSSIPLLPPSHLPSLYLDNITPPHHHHQYNHTIPRHHFSSHLTSLSSTRQCSSIPPPPQVVTSPVVVAAVQRSLISMRSLQCLTQTISTITLAVQPPRMTLREILRVPCTQ